MAAADPNDLPTWQALEEEIATKVTAAKAGGGYLYHSDHSIPKNVSLAQFQRVLELVRRYGA
jgi:uroporphyrinogen decarboxylase